MVKLFFVPFGNKLPNGRVTVKKSIITKRMNLDIRSRVRSIIAGYNYIIYQNHNIIIFTYYSGQSDSQDSNLLEFIVSHKYSYRLFLKNNTFLDDCIFKKKTDKNRSTLMQFKPGDKNATSTACRQVHELSLHEASKKQKRFQKVR